MTGRRVEHLLGSIGVLRHPCDLDLLLFFHRHPRAILTSERLAAYVGYDLNQLARSLDLLTNAGLVERSQNPTHDARLYVLTTPETGWLRSVLDIASTREGREKLIRTIKTVGAQEATDQGAGHDDKSARVRQQHAKRIAAR
ncbi:MAG: MarR family transcriptional regulator [Acidobacteria bacterium]|nr:MarR family transcriptional regulator [Acidobacteriota bacterium]